MLKYCHANDRHMTQAFYVSKITIIRHSIHDTSTRLDNNKTIFANIHTWYEVKGNVQIFIVPLVHNVIIAFYLLDFVDRSKIRWYWMRWNIKRQRCMSAFIELILNCLCGRLGEMNRNKTFHWMASTKHRISLFCVPICCFFFELIEFGHWTMIRILIIPSYKSLSIWIIDRILNNTLFICVVTFL